MNGAGSLCVTPSMLTWPSAIASSSAAWVLGGVRLISSASSRFVKIGPERNSNRPDCMSYTVEPSRSAGSRSGVNCTRLKSRPNAAANDRAISVFPRPGRSSMSTWPPASTVVRISVSAPRLPTTTRPISSRTASQFAVVVAPATCSVIPAPTVAVFRRAPRGRVRAPRRRFATRSPGRPTPTVLHRTASGPWRDRPRGPWIRFCPVAISN